MATVNAADAWQRAGRPADRSYPSPRSGWPEHGGAHGEHGHRPSRPVPPLPPHLRAAGQGRSHDDSGEFRRSASGQGAFGQRASGQRASGQRGSDSGRRRPAADRGYPAERAPARSADPHRSRVADPRSAGARRGRDHVPAETGGSRLRGILAVLAVFLVTLGGAAVDSFLGVGLGTITLVALVASAALATLLVRRRDIWSVVVSPPLVFVAVAAVDIGLAPSARFSLATVATLLIRGFPAMGIAAGVALVLALIRLAASRR